MQDVASDQLTNSTKVSLVIDRDQAARFGIQSIPTLPYFAGGEVRDKTIGAIGKRAILSKLERLATPVEPST